MSQNQSLAADHHQDRDARKAVLAVMRKRISSIHHEPGWQDRLKTMELHLDIRKQMMAERQLAQQAERERLAQRLSRSGLER